MELKQITKIYLDASRYLVKEKTYLIYSQINNNQIMKFNDELTQKNLNLFIVNLRKSYSYSTTKITKELINRSLKYAYENKILNDEIFINLKLKQQKTKQVEALSKLEQNKLENYILSNEKIKYYGILISLYTGIRIGELIALKWSDVDFKENILHITKTMSQGLIDNKKVVIETLPKTESSKREIPLSKNVIKILKALRNNSKSDYVIENRNHRQTMVRSYQKSFELLLLKLKIKHYGFHSLRHTFASRLLENGVDIKTISELMGHSNPTITLNRYVHTNIANKRKAVEKISK